MRRLADLLALSLLHFRTTRYRAQTAAQEAGYFRSRLGAVVRQRQLAAGAGCRALLHLPESLADSCVTSPSLILPTSHHRTVGPSGVPIKLIVENSQVLKKSVKSRFLAPGRPLQTPYWVSGKSIEALIGRFAPV